MSLGPLEEAWVTALIRQVTGADPDDGLRTATGAAAGNPLYVIELAQEPAGGAETMPESLITVVTRRLSDCRHRHGGSSRWRRSSGRASPSLS